MKNKEAIEKLIDIVYDACSLIQESTGYYTDELRDRLIDLDEELFPEKKEEREEKELMDGMKDDLINLLPYIITDRPVTKKDIDNVMCFFNKEDE